MNATAELPLWVATAPLWDMLHAALVEQRMPERELARKACIDPKMVRKIKSGDASAWTRIETAERLLVAAGCGEKLVDLDVVCAA